MTRSTRPGCRLATRLPNTAALTCRSIRIVAASPVVHESGMLPYRIVIRDHGDQHVVQTEVFEPTKEPWYHQGDYFHKGFDAPTPVGSDTEALRKAWARFEARARRWLRIDPPPTKRLAEVSDIAETNINALLPDDEDDCRELIDDHYQLQSDEDLPDICGSLLGAGSSRFLA
jgi:hypothetical protein